MRQDRVAMAAGRVAMTCRQMAITVSTNLMLDNVLHNATMRRHDLLYMMFADTNDEGD
jgi:hypothetical protein